MLGPEQTSWAGVGSAELGEIQAGIMSQDRNLPAWLIPREANLQHSLFSAVALPWM